MTTLDTTSRRRSSWVPYAGILVLFWGVWGAFSSLPTERYGYPDEMVYVIWAVTMILPALVAKRGQRLDRRPIATRYGLLVGLTGAGGQLMLFQALTIGPAYLIFPLVALSPAVTVLLALLVLRERLTMLAVIGVLMALAAVVFFSVSDDTEGPAQGPWLVLAILVCVAWGVQAFFIRKAATVGVNDATTFSWMTISGLLLIPVALLMMGGGLPGGFPWQAPALTGGTQLLNAIGALALVMALSRGKASIVAPVTNALSPVLTIVLSLLFYRTLPSLWGTAGIILALVGSTLMVYTDERRGEADTPDLAGARPRGSAD